MPFMVYIELKNVLIRQQKELFRMSFVSKLSFMLILDLFTFNAKATKETTADNSPFWIVVGFLHVL